MTRGPITVSADPTDPSKMYVGGDQLHDPDVIAALDERFAEVLTGRREGDLILFVMQAPMTEGAVLEIVEECREKVMKAKKK